MLNDSFTPEGLYFLHFALTIPGRGIGVIEVLLEYGADPNLGLPHDIDLRASERGRFYKGWTAAHVAMSVGSSNKRSALLVNYGCDFSRPDSEGWTPRRVASNRNQKAKSLGKNRAKKREINYQPKKKSAAKDRSIIQDQRIAPKSAQLSDTVHANSTDVGLDLVPAQPTQIIAVHANRNDADLDLAPAQSTQIDNVDSNQSDDEVDYFLDADLGMRQLDERPYNNGCICCMCLMGGWLRAAEQSVQGAWRYWKATHDPKSH